MSANPFIAVNHERHTLRRHVLRIRNLERRPGGAGSRRVYGAIDGGNNDDGFGAGILNPGSEDWTVETDGSGTWTITFDPPFNEKPVVVATSNETTTSPPADMSIVDRDVDHVTIAAWRVSGLDVEDDIGFDFIALGV